MAIKVSKVGHLVIRVCDLGRALAFYEGVLGLREVARRDFGEGPMVFLSTGNTHHDLALVEAEGSLERGAALHHFALKVGDSLGDLADARDVVNAAGVTVHVTLDHRVSQGLYITDPDGNTIELYVDGPEQTWRDDPALVANSDPLVL
jgi:catechol 2,3-dioxygenase